MVKILRISCGHGFDRYADAVRMWIKSCGCGADMDLILKKSVDAVRTWIEFCGCGADMDIILKNLRMRCGHGLIYADAVRSW